MKKLIITLGICTIVSAFSYSQNIELEEVFSNITVPNLLGLNSPGNNSPYLYALSQGGRIYRLDINNPEAEGELWLDISDRIISGGERGLLGLAFHPGFTENGRIYINYTAPDPLRTVIARYSADEGEADSDSEEIILEYEQPYTNHNGGQILFGPDGYLYISSGDGGSSGDPDNNSQDTHTLLGAILRLDVDKQDDGLPYAIPEDNPFYRSEEGRHEIYAWGLRNPWRFSFDRETGTLWTGDVGQSAWEAIHIIENGRNYGWNIIEGSHCYPPGSTCDTDGLGLPVYEYNHDEGRRSITGGFVYRGNLNPGLEGLYIYGDFVSGHIWALDYNANEDEVITNTELAETQHSISSFAEDANGELYVLSYGSGRIYRLQSDDPVSTERESELATGILLDQNYPNPFNPSTVISFELPQPAEVRLEVFDITGRLIITLTDGQRNAGRHEVTLHSPDLAGGIYLYTLTSGEHSITRKMLFIR